MKDLNSYKKHNSEYITPQNSVDYNKKLIKKYNEEKQFETLGFKKAIESTTTLPKTHIDIGSGVGWLLIKTSEYFNNVIGIEPSIAAIEISEQIIDKENINFLNKDMIDGIKTINPKESVFITTSTVLNHIQDYYVEEFLKLLNNLPNGSVLYFDERYDKNIQWTLWYIRNKSWWASNLKEWQLTFFNLKNSGYKSGIYGIKIGEQKVKNKYKQTLIQKVLWEIQKIYYKAKRKIIDIIKTMIK